ncbi:endoribonuclease Dcr-1-like [Sabethes cyaneus]|uniref:endoribonuclease Dcr-1-like n=1 Tax=Sabethes cyaneus TaxID=53552 RepID=UPI00237D6D11|nr:endoribonuclease Dcr-1-like [Sabethes cyaneus]
MNTPRGFDLDDFEPRDYQREMKKICLQKNTLIYLPPGAGKTHIALMVIKAMAGELTKPLSQGGKRTFFVVNTVALAKQQAEFLSRNLPYEMTVYTNGRNVDTWKQDRWLEEFAKYQVVVCTYQILLYVLKHGYLSIRHINLLIFDECQHGVGDHPMQGIMKQFLKTPKVDQPRVIGLSGMLLYRPLKSKDQIASVLEKLETTFLSTIATVGSYDAYTEVCKFSTNPVEHLIHYSDPVPTPITEMIIKGISEFVAAVENSHWPKALSPNKSLASRRDMPEPKKRIVQHFKAVIYQFQDLGLFGGSIALLGIKVQFELDKRQSDNCDLRLVYQTCITYCEELRHEIERSMEGLSIQEKVRKFLSNKGWQLINYLEENYRSIHDRTAKVLIFVERRLSAKVLYHLLKIYFSQTEKIVPDFMVGNNGFMPESIEQILRARKNSKVLDRFKKNQINVIVATSVLHQGIDLQVCNTVVKYDRPHTFASYEQSKGRARMKDSQYVIFVNDAEKDKLCKQIALYRSFEDELQRCLIGKTINRPEMVPESRCDKTNDEIIRQSESNKYFKHWNDFADDCPELTGTQKRVRSHTVKNPSQTTNCFPQPGKPCYVYIIRIKARFEQDPTNKNIQIFHQLYSTENNFGIMTTKALPMLAGIKLFVTLGLIDVQLMLQPIILSNAGNRSELEELKNFHVMIFRDMLKLWKQFLVEDHSNDANSFLIVPLKRSQEIDWSIVRKFPCLKKPTDLTPKAREKMTFKQDRYHHSVILPWYKNNVEQFYVVTMVHAHLTPESPFPIPQYRSYEHYFCNQYQQHVVNKQQFLIEVKAVTTSFNLLCPGSEEAGRSARSKHSKFNEILIPELCYNFEFPADYWLKATMLPSVLHRIQYLLHAENLRVKLATVAGVGCLENRSIDGLDIVYKERLESNNDEDDKNVLTKPQAVSQLRCEQLNNFSGGWNLPWAEKEEPEDIDSKWDEITQMDIDYHDAFVRKYSNFRLNSSYMTYGNPRRVAAIGAVPLDVKFAIKLLTLTPQSTARVSIQQKDIIKAITTKSAGDVYDLERNELLGDAFLKFATSVYLFKNHKDWNEGYLTAVKAKLISNRNLVYCALRIGTPGMMKIHIFDPKNDWQPPLATVPQKIKLAMASKGNQSAKILCKLQLSEAEVKSGTVNSEKLRAFMTLLNADNTNVEPSPMQNYLSQQMMNDKVAADAMEALLGVCVSSVGVKRSFKMLSYLGILPKTQDLMTMLDGKIQNQRLKTDISPSEVDAFLVNHTRIEEILNYKFKDRTYLLQALTHASVVSNRITGSYQQLEFLGDAVLDFLISAYIYEQNPTMSPGQLTDLRSALVNNETLACLLVRNGLHLYILSESAWFTETVNKFVAFQELQQHRITGEVNLLAEETSERIGKFVDVPKALGDVFESLVGAIFLDSGNDLEVTWKVLYGMMHNEILSFTKDIPIQIVRQLYELKPPCLPEFGPPIIEGDTVKVKLQYCIRNETREVYGVGHNKDNAKRAAAMVALNELKRQ